MVLAYDPEIAAVMSTGTGSALAAHQRGDWASLRQTSDDAFAAMGAALPATPAVSTKVLTTAGHGGSEIELHWYVRDGGASSSAAVYLHPGGMVAGSVAFSDPYIRRYVDDTGVSLLAPEYRLAPEHPHPIPVEDCYAGLVWLVDHAAELGVDPGRIGVFGESAGGGMAAAVALLARERGLALARQILVCPMLDDRTTDPDPHLVALASWSYDANWTAWSALLGREPGGPDVPWSAAPARATDVTGLPPAYIEVGELDIYRDESIDYARHLQSSGVPVDLHVFAGAPHGFDFLAPAASSSRLAHELRRRALQAI
jgi:acetyl esterase/lipase